MVPIMLLIDQVSVPTKGLTNHMDTSQFLANEIQISPELKATFWLVFVSLLCQELMIFLEIWGGASVTPAKARCHLSLLIIADHTMYSGFYWQIYGFSFLLLIWLVSPESSAVAGLAKADNICPAQPTTTTTQQGFSLFGHTFLLYILY